MAPVRGAACLAGVLLLSAYAQGQSGHACDLNGDGVVDAQDVQAAINMTLGLSPCTARIAGPGVCNALVIQRVVNAWRSGNCLTSTGLHVVVLSWTASTSSGVIGYNVYRRGISGGRYKVIASPDNVTSYVDTTVVSGQTYEYVVTARNSGRAESAYSSPVRAVIPMP